MQNYTGVRKFGLSVLALWLAAASFASWAETAPPALRDDAPLEYTVKKGDTLWDISSYFLKDPFLWPEIWDANRTVKNPHLIYPGEKLYLTWVGGRPRLSRDAPTGGTAASGTTKLQPRIRSTAAGEEIPAIPLEAILAFLQGPRIVDLETLNSAPYIVDFDENHIFGDVNVAFYVRHLDRDAGDTFSVVEIGKMYQDPETGEDIGQEVIPTALAEVVRQDRDDVITLMPTSIQRELRRGNRLLPPDDLSLPNEFFPHSPTEPVNARVLAVFGTLTRGGRGQIVTLNRGRKQGLEVGHVLDTYTAPRTVPDPNQPEDAGVPQGPPSGYCCGLVMKKKEIELPAERTGRVMIFTTYPNISYALVLESKRPIRVADILRTPKRSP